MVQNISVEDLRGGIGRMKVSVIIPVYNTEEYIDECLNSVRNQTLKDIEIICVNDGSTDGSLAVLEKYAKEDKRIKIINQKNQGVSVARNNGIANAQGEYIMFLDSDDYLVPYACEKEYKLAVKNKADVVGFEFRIFKDGKTFDLFSIDYDSSKINIYTRKENENPFLALRFNCNNVNSKIWRRSFINENNLSFKEGLCIGEDTLFAMLSALKLYKFVKDENEIYVYRTARDGSAVTTLRKNVKEMLNNCSILLKELADNRDEFSFEGSDEWLLLVMIFFVHYAVHNNFDNSTDNDFYLQRIFKIIDKDFLKKYNIVPPKKLNEKLYNLRHLIKNNID